MHNRSIYTKSNNRESRSLKMQQRGNILFYRIQKLKAEECRVMIEKLIEHAESEVAADRYKQGDDLMNALYRVLSTIQK